MPEHPNVQLLRDAIAAFSRGDVDAARDLLHDDVVYHFPGNSAIAGDHRGRDAVLAFFAEIARLTGRSIRVKEHDILATDRHGVSLVEVTASREGRDLTWRQANIYHIRDGKIAEAWLQPESQTVMDEFLS